MPELNNLTLLGLCLTIPGVLMLLLGWRQQRRQVFGVVSLTSAHFKLVTGGALLVLGLNSLLYSLATR